MTFETETRAANSIPRHLSEWRYRKLLIGGWMIHRPLADDPDDAVQADELGEVESEDEARRICAQLNATAFIPTEGLESGAIGELVALLNEAVNDMEHTSLRGMMSGQVKRFRESLDKLQRLQARLQS